MKYHHPYTLLLLLALLQLAGCAVAPDNSRAASRQRNANLSDAMRQANGSAVTVPKAGYSRERSAMQVEQHKPRDVALDLSLQAEMSDAPDVSNGISFEYSQIQYTSGPLMKGQFYALYFEQFDEERTGSLGYRLSYGTYTCRKQVFGRGIRIGQQREYRHLRQVLRHGHVGIHCPPICWPPWVTEIWHGAIANRSPTAVAHLHLRCAGLYGVRVGLGAELGVARFYLGRTREGFNNDAFADRIDLTWGGTLGCVFWCYTAL